jgi:hypothetical protein
MQGLTEAIEEIALREEFYKDVKVPGDANSFDRDWNKDALHRNESCGGHFRYQSEDGSNEMMKFCLRGVRCKRSCSQSHRV